MVRTVIHLLHLQSNTESVTTPSSTAGLSGQSVIYINSDVEHNFNVNSSNQVIQITKPYSSNQHTETKGYGKWIDNSYNLVKVECYVNDVLKQWVAFHGFNTNGSVVGNSELLNANSNTFNYFTNPSQADSWSGNNNKLGFRLRGNIALKDINYSDISDNVGHPQSTAHTVKYKYIRHEDVGGVSDKETSFNVYIDNLPDNPVISDGGQIATVIKVIWSMGIPSVEMIDIDISRNYSKINSEYMYIPGNRVIAKIKDIQRVNKNTDKSITLARDTVSGTNNKIISAPENIVTIK